MRKSSDEQDRLTLLSTFGALFFGVPSQGMDINHLVAMVENLPARYTVNLLDREVGMRLRKRQHDDFCWAFPFPDCKIIQFFETRKTKTNSGVRNSHAA